ncbi:Resolvase protein [Halorhabdus tiamatea SARL4B]|uniref:Resolvase protein n=2 Tax=Halorhabdus TaxID=146825 RepID=U2E416_9EURY|nr:recombinase family protein [Halorhabdus tiamatea]ERJ06696.1 Resolvase protein [Halorhabdus tiamatea SARL4B]
MKGQTSSEETSSDGALAYVRVSSKKQVRNGRSLKDQKNWATQEAEERGLELVNTITDAAESGTDFEREGIRKLRKEAKNERISYVIVDELDRIGRHAVETLYYIYELQTDHSIEIISNEARDVLDVSQYQDLSYVVNRALASQSTVETQARRAEAGRARNFVEKNWYSAFEYVPVGYKENEADDWISTEVTEIGIVQELFDNFIKSDISRPFVETLEKTPLLPEEFGRRRLRNTLERPLYVGKPTTAYVDYTRNDDSKEETTVIDRSLRIISDETREKALEKLREVGEYHAFAKEDEGEDVESLVSEYGAEAVVDCSDAIQIRCPECDAEMMKNGLRESDTYTGRNYVCPDCGRQRMFPKQTEMDQLRDQSEDN